MNFGNIILKNYVEPLSFYTYLCSILSTVIPNSVATETEIKYVSNQDEFLRAISKSLQDLSFQTEQHATPMQFYVAC